MTFIIGRKMTHLFVVKNESRFITTILLLDPKNKCLQFVDYDKNTTDITHVFTKEMFQKITPSKK